jgi:hypothetical protein
LPINQKGLIVQMPFVKERIVLQPWQVSSPLQLTSWFDVLQFSARSFFWIGGLLESLATDCLLLPAGGSGSVPFPIGVLRQPLDNETKEKALATLKMISEACTEIGMPISAETASDIGVKVRLDAEYSYDSLMNESQALKKLIEKEMKGKFFLYIPPERAKFWPRMNNQNLFGETVADKFPSAKFDIGNSGVCLGTMMSTASVFHLMRVMEIGLGALGKVFGVSLAYTNWETALNQIESKIANMRSDPTWKVLPDCKEQQEYYSQAASYFRTVKDAWRNYTMHSRAKYTEDEAEQIFNSVKGFMQKLAERLSE